MTEAGSNGADEPRSRHVERLTAELESLLARELLRTWRELNASHFRFALKPPVIQLVATTTVLGRWDRVRRTIELSRPLVVTRPWGEVVEVLKHEMAHQFVHESLGVTDEPPHGPTFRQLCERLRIDGSATGAVEAGEPDPERDKIRQKVANLLALAQSTNRFEAENAASLAQRLMLKHNIAMAEKPERRRYAYRQLGEPKGRVQECEHILASILGEHFFVEVIWVSAFRPGDGKRGHVLELCGTPENLEIAGYVHAFMLATSERLWQTHARENGVRSNRERRTFLAGVMEGFRERLATEKRRSHEQGLVWVGDPELKGYYRSRHPHVRSVRLRGQAPSDARTHGREAGRNIVLHRGMSEAGSASTGPRALPPKRG
ncbi:MAG: DUF2786 domain-containing protein [Deltaproteobacteria bacterium]|nr:DUF2786 domain-containing protein [Deltaproteobacteria bacterium]